MWLHSRDVDLEFMLGILLFQRDMKTHGPVLAGRRFILKWYDNVNDPNKMYLLRMACEKIECPSLFEEGMFVLYNRNSR